MSQDHDLDEEMEMAPGQVAQVAAATAPPIPDEPEPTIDLLDMDQVLLYTQKRRVKGLNLIDKALGEIQDPALFSAYFKGLGDMDKAVVQRKRVGIEEEAAKTAEESARDHAALLRAIHAQAMQVPVGQSGRTEAPRLPAEMAKVDLVPGELDQGTHEMSYEGFAQEVGGKPAV